LILRFIASLRGHVGPVYQVCWSSDSRLLISASKDSTLKVWDLKTKKIKLDLPGHLDEVCTSLKSCFVYTQFLTYVF